MAGEEQTDAAILAGLEFTPRPVCEMAEAGCASGSAVYTVCRGCRSAVPTCAHHVMLMRAYASRFRIYCRVCRRTGSTLDEVMQFVPIPAGA